jgi:hypothetical protein
MPRDDIVAEARSIASELLRASRTRRIKSKTEISILGLLNGALYGIIRAAELGYDDLARARPDPASHLREFVHTTAALATGATPPPSPWLSGYYFGNAVLRLDIVRDKDHLNIPASAHSLYEVARRAANNFKHTAPAMMVSVDERKQTRFDITLSDGIIIARMLVAAFVTHLEALQS